MPGVGSEECQEEVAQKEGKAEATQKAQEEAKEEARLETWKNVVAESRSANFVQEWETQLTTQTSLKSGSEYADMSAEGYSMMDVAQTSLLDAGASETVDISLPVGSAYILMGVCDNDCLDLDLALLSGGIELSEDTTDDDWPLVEVTPTSNPTYQVKVTMYNCSTPNCGYQLTVWKK